MKKRLAKQVVSLVPMVGVEPTRYRYHGILSPARLPIPPQRHILFVAISFPASDKVFPLF